MTQGEILRANIAGTELVMSKTAEHVPGFGGTNP